MALPIIFEDQDILVVNKQPGLLTATVPHERRKTLLKLVEEYVTSRDRAARVGLIHRLDKDASGLLIFSKNHPAYRSLKQQFFDHSVERIYTALVHGAPNPASGRVESRLVERADGSVYSTRRPGQGELAISEYELLEKRDGVSLVRVRLFTGRKHQIRVHLSQRGAPIVGDPVYARPEKGATRENVEQMLMLVATQLSIDHPRTGQRMTFTLPIPRIMKRAGMTEKPAK